jgi:hypothetical protein
VARRSPL